MAQQKRTRQHGISRDLAMHLEGNLGKNFTVDQLAKSLRATPQQVQAAASYIKHKQAREQEDTWRIITVKRGKAWKAVAVEGNGAADQKVTMRLKETRVVPLITEPVPASEPEATFQIIGTIRETGELVLRGTSAGVSGTWLARSL